MNSTFPSSSEIHTKYDCHYAVEVLSNLISGVKLKCNCVLSKIIHDGRCVVEYFRVKFTCIKCHCALSQILPKQDNAFTTISVSNIADYLS